MKNVYILGISAFYHNSAAALVCNGNIVAAAEEERFTRIKGLILLRGIIKIISVIKL